MRRDTPRCGGKITQFGRRKTMQITKASFRG